MRDRHIDGLRAIAVGMVVAAHCGVPRTGGGFAGVDVFFVISGFLITRLLITEQARCGRIDLIAFWARRARRLVPALVAMLLAILAAGVLLLLPDEQAFLAEAAASSLAFAANIHFVTIAQDYFAPRSVLSPLQHLWTLGVEAQFYLAWPLLIFLLARSGALRRFGPRAPIAIALSIVTAVSLTLSIALSPRDPVGSFYLLHTRAWELGIGGLLCVTGRVSGALTRFMPALGLVALLATTVLFRGLPYYPGYFAILPVAGAALIIIGGIEAPASLVARGLGCAPMVYVGRRSYGFYLWHWPLLAFARIWWSGRVDAFTLAVLMVVAFALAVVSWAFVEEPIIRRRHLARMTDRAVIAVAGGALLFCGALALAMESWSARALQPGTLMAQYRAARSGQRRDFPFCNGRASGPGCVLGARDAQQAILLFGDSHAAQLSYPLDAAAKSLGIRVVVRTMASCAPTGFDVYQPATQAAREACRLFNKQVLADLPDLRRKENVGGVIVVGAWDNAGSGWGGRLAAVVDAMRGADMRVIIARDTPAQPENFIRAAMTVSGTRTPVTLATVYRARREELATLSRIARQPNTRIWSPLPALCPHDLCVTEIDGTLLYRNPTHLTVSGALRLAPSLVGPVRWVARGEEGSLPVMSSARQVSRGDRSRGSE